MNTKKPMSIAFKCSKEMRKRIEVAAEKDRRTMSGIILLAIEAYLLKIEK